MQKTRARAVINVTVLTIILIAWDRLSTEPKNWLIQVSPISLFRLDSFAIKALLLTFATSLVAWLLGSALGIGIGIVLSVGVLDTHASSAPRWHAFAKRGDMIYDAIYIIPLVLTISFAHALLVHLQANFIFPSWALGVCMIAVAGSALGGYHVYKSIFNAANKSRSEAVYLTESLWFKAIHQSGTRHLPLAWLARVLRRRDCEIFSYCEAIEKSFHLAIVSVVILEMVVPNVYENFWPQTAIAQAWLGGTGRYIFQARQNNEITLIAGCVWAVSLFDAVCVRILGSLLHHRWLRFYIEMGV